jgi:hypothetical protein
MAHTWNAPAQVRSLTVTDHAKDELEVRDPGCGFHDCVAVLEVNGVANVHLTAADRRAVIVALGGIVDYGSERV